MQPVSCNARCSCHYLSWADKGDRIDDIEDDSQLRRGAPGQWVSYATGQDRSGVSNVFSVTHKIYGIPQTINTANYVYFLAYKELFALRNGETTPPRRSLDAVVTGSSIDCSSSCHMKLTQMPEELLSLHRGQGLEILWRDSLQCPTEEEYIRMVNNSAWFSRYLPSPGANESPNNLSVETGGLLRIGIKLMMACSTENTDVYEGIQLSLSSKH